MSLRRIDVAVVMVTVVVIVTRVAMATEQFMHQKPASSAQEQVKTYEGYRVYDVRVSGKREAARVVQEAQLCSAELWNDDQTAGTLQLQVGPGNALPLESALNRSGVSYHLRIDDIQRLINEQSAQNRNSTRRDDHFRHDVYHTFSEIRRHLERQSIDHADRMLLEVIGVSHERRPLYLARLTSSTVSQPHRPIMWLDCGIHAREWVSPAICLYIIDRLLHEDRHWLLHYDWHIAPVLNPDGYVYSHEHDRLWRKNRSANHYCRGVDLNRNFAAFWGTFGVTFFECGATFPGYRPFSEPESRAVRDAVLRHRGRVAAFSSVHSYGQLWLVPYGYKWFRSAHWRQHKRVARRATLAMRAVNGVSYRHGISSLMLYLDSGTSTDWAYREGVKHSVAIEARDLGYYGFLLPPHFILPTAAEVWAGLMAQAEAILR